MHPATRRNCIGFTFLFLFGAVLFSAPLDGPAATVNLIRGEIITRQQLKQRFEETEEVRIQTRLPIPPQTEEQVLDAMIAEILIRQAAEREGISVTENEINIALENQRRSAELQLRTAGTSCPPPASLTRSSSKA